ncbi:MAG TPA: hypothetical protein PLP17_05330 [Oligoflexia bacterium]|nr:hypothetical protein [Oligoflexia bacterium]
MRWTTDAAHQARTESSARLMEKLRYPMQTAMGARKNYIIKVFSNLLSGCSFPGKRAARPSFQLIIAGAQASKIKS